MKTINEQLPEPPERAETTALKDRTFETLSNPRRRQALRYLRTREDDGPVSIRELAEQIAAWENDVPPVEVTYKQRKRVYTSLYQSHLPRLHKYGFIEYDADRGTIELTPQAESLDVYLEVVPAGNLPWSDVYLGTSILVAALVATLYLAPIPLVTGWHALVFSTVLFAVISLVHSYQTRQNGLYERSSGPRNAE
jgi:DNA-binding transcriptional ArsR family regulator